MAHNDCAEHSSFVFLISRVHVCRGIAGPATLRALTTATDSRLEVIELLHR